MFQIFIHFFSKSGRVIQKKRFGMLLLLFSIWAYATTGFMYFELSNNPDLSWTDASWWAVVTMTTVGYGDLSPSTVWGQLLVGYPTMLLGVSILGYLLSLVASVILESKLKEIKGMKQIKFKDHILICGFNSIDHIQKIISEIRMDKHTEKSALVLIDEHLEEIPSELKEMDIAFVKGNPARENVLERANFKKARCMLIIADLDDPDNTDQKNLAIALTAERLSPEIFTVIECANPENAVFFEHAHCDSIVCVQALSSQIMVQELQDPGVHNIIEELTSNKHGMQFYTSDIPVGIPNCKLLREYFDAKNALMLGINRQKKNIFIPPPDMQIQAGDRVILIANERLI